MTVLAIPAPQQLVLDHVSWEYYDHTLRELDGQHHRISYFRGRMEIMTVGQKHEAAKTAIARLLETYSLEAAVPIYGMGSVTCRREDLACGLEPDECYYITTRMPIADHEGELDLTREPPPDFAVEVDITRSSVDRQSIYAALGVREIWRYDGGELISLHRAPDGRYERAERSVFFPEVPLDEFARFVKMAMVDQYGAAVAFRDWLRTRAGRKA